MEGVLYLNKYDMYEFKTKNNIELLGDLKHNWIVHLEKRGWKYLWTHADGHTHYFELKDKFKKGQRIKSGHYGDCVFIVIGYKHDNYILVIREGVEDKFTNREILYDKHCWLVDDEDKSVDNR